MNSEKSGFTLLEVIIAMTLFALVSIPTIALMTMTARKSDNRLGQANASELMSRIDSEVEQALKVDPPVNFDSVGYLYASEDLSLIGFEPEIPVGVGRFYRIDLQKPAGYTFNAGDSYRVFIYDVIWPAYIDGGTNGFVDNSANTANLERMTVSSAILITQ